MEFFESEDEILLRLARGEKIIESLTQLADRRGLGFCWFNAIGAVENAELGFFVRDQKEYRRKTFSESFELVSLIGNITEVDGSPFCHAHVVLGDADFRLWGGHLFEATVSVTCELVLRSHPFTVPRSDHEEVGLNLWNLDQCRLHEVS